MFMEFPAELKGKLIVSCQAPMGSPLHHTETLCRIAACAIEGGVAGLRTNGVEVLTAMRRQTSVPILAIEKRVVEGRVLITPDFRSAASLALAGASVIALDCTAAPRLPGESWQILIARIHEELKLPVLADIATLDEARLAVNAGADAVATTLYGYTPETADKREISWELMQQLTKELPVPILAEGHLRMPQEARRCLELGAYAVVVGAAITRPDLIASGFIQAMSN